MEEEEEEDEEEIPVEDSASTVVTARASHASTPGTSGPTRRCCFEACVG